MAKYTSVNSNYANEILDDVECYKMVLGGRLKTFPKWFWTKPWSVGSANTILKYLLEERLKYTREDICKNLSTQTFITNKLFGMLVQVFSSSAYEALNSAYPSQFKPWELRNVPSGFWDDIDNIKEAVRWVVDTKLGNNRQRVCKEYNSSFLRKNGLNKLIQYGIYDSLNITYPNQFMPWEISNVPLGFWKQEENIIKAVRWVVENKLGDSRERVCKEFSVKMLHISGLRVLGDMGVVKCLNLAYPNEFKPWELGTIQNNYFKSDENVKEVVRWLVETKLGNNRERVCKEFNKRLLIEHRLYRLQEYGIYKCINLTYPEEFKPWELSSSPKNFWRDGKNIREALNWLVVTKFGNNTERVQTEMNYNSLVNNGFSALLKYRTYRELKEIALEEVKNNNTVGNTDRTNRRERTWIIE